MFFSLHNLSAVKLGWISMSAFLLTQLANCFEITGADQPAKALVGEEITIDVDVKLSGKDGSTLVFGFLAPKAWKPAEVTSVSFSSTIGNGTMSLMPPDEVDAENKLPWAPQIREKVGFGQNYGEVEWIVFKADQDLTPPGNTSPENPVTGVVTVKTRAGASNMIAQLGYFVGEAVWGYLEGDNSNFFFSGECIEITGADGQPQNLCGPAPRKLVNLETYTFNDILTIIFDAQEDSTALIGANKVFFCSRAIHEGGVGEACDFSAKTEMTRVGEDLWNLTLWPKSYYNIPEGSGISEILANFQDETGGVIVRDVSGNDFQILEKCF